MNLKIQLLYRILFIAVLCLMASAFYVLHQTDQQAISEANLTANRIENQLDKQLLQMFTRYDYSNTFPNTKLWPDTNGLAGSCIQFLSRDQNRHRNLCNQAIETERNWPIWFGSLYQHLFSPYFEVKKDISFNAITYGSVVITLNGHIETARAWNNLRAVIDVLFISILALCLLVYVTINRLLKPAQIIVSGLEKMSTGKLETRLPSFDINEWKRTSDAINQLASSQERSIGDNKKLAWKLINIQEDEHRYIARELHDEFGQCLAGINAVTTSINQSAKIHYPDILDETDRIRHITNHMMDVLRNLLTRLRPADVDEIGLALSLKKLIDSWNKRSLNQTFYSVIIDDCDNLPDPLPVNIYRIVQECLTNISKHAQASVATVILSKQNQNISLSITDDGIAEVDSFDNTVGVGLLGIRERVLALGGELELISSKNKGLIININIPAQHDE
ncbi:MAG: sensor histidine kinase [Piscirickettsiaceae bacterium]|nr:sensor histidine kinase [Piscirickettsiaceae bacterium]